MTRIVNCFLICRRGAFRSNFFFELHHIIFKLLGALNREQKELFDILVNLGLNRFLFTPEYLSEIQRIQKLTSLRKLGEGSFLFYSLYDVLIGQVFSPSAEMDFLFTLFSKIAKTPFPTYLEKRNALLVPYFEVSLTYDKTS